MKYFRYDWVPYTEVLKILLTGQADDEQRSPTRTERKHFCAFTLIKLALKLLVLQMVHGAWSIEFISVHFIVALQKYSI